jgi:hypothetical protein
VPALSTMPGTTSATVTVVKTVPSTVVVVVTPG